MDAEAGGKEKGELVRTRPGPVGTEPGLQESEGMKGGSTCGKQRDVT
jgi:hypothetical protein